MERQRRQVLHLAAEVEADTYYITGLENYRDLAEAYALVVYAQGHLERSAAVAAFSMVAARLP